MPSKIVRIGTNVEIELLLGARRQWLGVGSVRIGGVETRDRKHPMLVRLDTPEGIVYSRFTLDGVKTSPKGQAVVALRAIGEHGARQEYQDEYNQQTMTVGAPRQPVEDLLLLHLAPVAEEIGGRNWAGFEWSLEFRSKARQVHRVVVDGSWELGGSLVGDTVLSQGQCNTPVYRGAKATLFTTSCLKTLNQYGSPRGVSYQLGPRGGIAQGFDFQFSPKGLLLHYWPDMDAISSILESPKGDTHLYVIDEYRVTLGKTVRTTPQRVLLSAGKTAEHEARDAWWAAREHVYGLVRKQYGVAGTLVRPEGGLKYRTRVEAGPSLKMTICGVEADSREVPYVIAEHVLPRMAKLGVRRFFPDPFSESDVTVLGMRRKLDAGIHGDLHCCSVCATHRFLPSEFWGGMKAWRAMAEAGRALGVEVGAWFAPHLSHQAEIFRQHPEYRLVDVHTLQSGGGYGIHSISTADWNTGLFDWVLNDIRRWREEGALDYLFTDSWANMGLLQRSYAAGMRTNFRALGRLYGEFNKIGLKVLSFEGMSAFGVSRIGMADLRSDDLAASGGIVGQNDFGWWYGQEDMAVDLAFHLVPRKRTEEDIQRIQFRMMAARGGVLADALCDTMYEGAEWVSRYFRIYEQALPHMRTRHLLPGLTGARWDDGKTSVIWTFADVPLDVPGGAKLERLTGAAPEPIAATGTVTLPAWGVYRMA